MNVTRRSHQRSTRRAVVTVEMALALPLLLLLLLGIVEVGLVVMDAISLQNAAREAVRLATLGRTTSQVSAQVSATLTTVLPAQQVTVTLHKRAFGGGVWSAWTVLGDTTVNGTAQNNAATGDQVRVTLTYGHPLVTGYVLGSLAPQGLLQMHVSSVALHM